MPLSRWVEPQLSKLVEKAPAGPNWDQMRQIAVEGGTRRANTDRYAEIIAIEGDSYRLKEAHDRAEQRARQRRGAKP